MIKDHKSRQRLQVGRCGGPYLAAPEGAGCQAEATLAKPKNAQGRLEGDRQSYTGPVSLGPWLPQHEWWQGDHRCLNMAFLLGASMQCPPLVLNRHVQATHLHAGNLS